MPVARPAFGEWRLRSCSHEICEAVNITAAFIIQGQMCVELVLTRRPDNE